MELSLFVQGYLYDQVSKVQMFIFGVISTPFHLHQQFFLQSPLLQKVVCSKRAPVMDLRPRLHRSGKVLFVCPILPLNNKKFGMLCGNHIISS
jgi:hypothetical protein